MLGYGKIVARQALLRAMHSRSALRNRRKVRRRDIRRILVMRPDHLGDLLFATPSLEIIRQSFPDGHITGAVGPWGRAMWEGNPNLDALVTIPFPGIAGHNGGGSFAPYRLLGDTAERLKGAKYDLGIALRFDHWWGAALMWAAGIPYRWGYNTPGMGAWLTDKVRFVPGKHEVEQDIRLLEAMLQGTERQRAVSLRIDRERGTPPLKPPTPIPPPNVDDLLGAWLASSRRAVIHPGTGAANKLWTISGWAEVIAKLMAEGWAVALTGSPTERALSDAIINVEARHTPPMPSAGTPPLINVAGKTSNLGELAWVLREAHMVLGVDSGPLHIATALGKPTLHLYGPTDESIWGPWGDSQRHRPLRAPGTHPTMHLDVGSKALEGGPEMRSITPEMVLAEVSQLARHV